MFRLHKSKPSKSGEKIDFKLSHLKAQQVPKGWDKLFVSVISSENGRTLAKSTKAPVRNGSCQWTDTLSESIWISRDNISKEMEDCFLKLLVAMGSSRSNILGEATVCLSSYTSSSSAVPLSIPLNKCNHGTVLDVKLQCLMPSTKFRDEEPRESNPQIKGLNAKIHDVTIKSKGSDYSGAESVESSSIKDLDSTSSPGEVESRATSFSGSASQYSYNSADGSIGKGIFSSSIHLRDDRQTPNGRQDSTSSQKSVSQGNMSNSSKNRPEAAENTIEELRAEAKMWEMNARKLMADLDILRADFSDQSKNLANLAVELSAANLERDNLKNVAEQLKLSVEEPTMKQKGLEDSTFEGVRIPDIEKALNDELRFQKESSANLSLQLERSQESNIELVSVLQELEETIEQQKIEIENLSALPSKRRDLENSLQLSMKGNNDLTSQLQQLEESKKSLLVKVQQLEDALEQKKHDIEEVTIPNNKILSDIEMEYESKLSAKEEEITSLKAKLSESLQQRHNAEPEILFGNGDEADLMREIEELKKKVQELEMDCNELTDENLDLLYKLKEAKKNSRKARASDDCSLTMLKDQCFESEVSSNILENNDEHISIQELENVKIALEVRVTKLSEELTGKLSELANLEAIFSSKEKEIGVLQKHQSELEAKICHLEDEKMQIEEHMEVMLKERDVNSRCLYDLRNDLATLSRRMDSHISANKVLERKSSDLEKRNHELELYASEVEQEKGQLSVCISVLEAQLRDLTNERESLLSEQENSKSVAARLQEEMRKVKYDMDSASENFEEKLKEMQFQSSEASQECESLRRANQLLQTAITELTDECSSLQKLNGDLRKKNLELQEYCSLKGTRLKESDKRFIDCSERVELMEKKFALMREDVASKENSLNSELDVLVDENRKHIEWGQSLLNQMHIENTEEIQRLQQEIEYLSMNLSATYDEKERIASNAVLEVSALRADKAKLESSFQASNNEAINMRTEYEQKLQDIATELAAFKTNQEKLLKLVEDYKSREVKLKSTLNALELKLTVAEYEKQQLTKESGNLKNQLQQIDQFENEIMALKSDLNSTNSEKERLESALREMSELCEDLKAQKTSYDAKILTMEKDVSELEDCKRSRDALEERLLQMESELKEKEASFAQNAEQKNELSHIRRINRQNEQTIQLLEREKNESLIRIQALEEELKLIKEQKRNQMSRINRKGLPLHEDQKVSKNNMVKNTSQNRSSKKKSSLKNDRENVKEDLNSNKHQSEVETDSGLLDETVYGAGVDALSKIQLLETELTKAKEANSKYEVQLNRFMSQGQINHANGRIKSTAEGETVTKDKFERIKSMLEAELRDIQQRYLHMSLKYAEVEAQREELVMKLKAAKVKKGWLS